MNDGPDKADYETYASIRELFSASADIYQTKERRISAIDQHLDDLLNACFVGLATPSVMSDGVVVHMWSKSQAHLVIREVKNEIGTGGSKDPYNQGSLSYRKYWAAQSRK